jgi:hypothetical protein
VASRNELDEHGGASGPFVAGATVLISLVNPREKFWGVLLGLNAAGVSVRAIDLNSFDDFVSLLRAREPATPSEIFFPMHRIERIEADLRNGDIPSLSERFATSTGCAAESFFRTDHDRSLSR